MIAHTIFRVYYMKPLFLSEGLLGKVTTDLEATHVYLKDVVLPGTDTSRLDTVWTEMQSDHWSPFGEASGLIAQKGLAHTSMSVGDVVTVNGRAFVVDTFGFKELPRNVLRNVPDERGALL